MYVKLPCRRRRDRKGGGEGRMYNSIQMEERGVESTVKSNKTNKMTMTNKEKRENQEDRQPRADRHKYSKYYKKSRRDQASKQAGINND